MYSNSGYCRRHNGLSYNVLTNAFISFVAAMHYRERHHS